MNAWFSAVTPSNICSGFKKAGVYLFNTEAVVLHSTSGDQNGKGLTRIAFYGHLTVCTYLMSQLHTPYSYTLATLNL